MFLTGLLPSFRCGLSSKLMSVAARFTWVFIQQARFFEEATGRCAIR